MKITPSPKAMRGRTKEDLQRRVEEVCQVIGTILAIASTFGLFIKILFF